jgi:YVTN family beta-propeller protein
MALRRTGTAGVAIVTALAVIALGACSSHSHEAASRSASSTTRATTAPSSTTSSTTTTTVPPPTTAPLPAADTTHLTLAQDIQGAISPKSVDAAATGRVFAQNMMYRHTITVYSPTGDLVATIPDTVDLSKFGITGHPGISHGAPVEGAFSPDGRKLYVSNYSMYGAGFGPEGTDTCSPASGYDDSFVYRVNTSTLAVDQVIPVGPVPKYVATTPDGRYVLVTNWCGYDLSIIDRAAGRTIRTIPLGRYPRGIAVSPDSVTAYIGVMGTTNVAAVNLRDFQVSWMNGVGSGPRHVVISPDGRDLYVTLNGAGVIAKIDLATRTVVGRVHTGSEPRSMAISADGTALYVVNYASDSVTKLRASDLSVLQTISTPHHPIGITYDKATRDVWVSCYEGHILLFADD